jgi:polysaccharide pyruvyl transferase WcaK-like protein
MDLVIGIRFHSLILAVAEETPVIGVGYHQKVRSYMTRLDKRNLYIDVDQ